jgi:murein DD-endopeptidase MepM/ murein hydrolase activator NlpD
MSPKNALSVLSMILSILVAPAARAELALGPFLPSHIWPIALDDVADRGISSTFGPRLRQSTIYDFHRGIDIPAPHGTPLYAIADGKVRIAGSHPGYTDPLIQLRHYKPGSGGSCANRGCYQSNYMHISSSVVVEDQLVKQGDLIGYSGESAAGFKHLHFEIRDGGLNRMDCIHPLAVLPFDDLSAPGVTIASVDLSSIPASLGVGTSIIVPPSEIDLNRVEVSVFDASQSLLIPVDSFACDFNEWNRLYSPLSDPDAYLNDPTFQGVVVSPAAFKAGTPQYQIGFSFENLSGEVAPANLLVKVRATDVTGHATEVYSP